MEQHVTKYSACPFPSSFIASQSVLGTLVGKRYVRVGFNRGNAGWGFMHDNCLRLQNELYTTDINSSDGRDKIRRTIHLYYLGDNDKQGNHMTANDISEVT
jgi:hypothetical protein